MGLLKRIFFLLFQFPYGNKNLLDLKGLALIPKDLAAGIYFPQLKQFFFSAVIHFVSVTEPCLSSKTYHTALAD